MKNPLFSGMERARQLAGYCRSRQLKLQRCPPNLAYLDWIRPRDVVIDVGTGPEADFSMAMVRRHGAECFCVDPTRKHASALRELERREPLIHFLPHALASESREREFFESTENESGSLLEEHTNVLHGSTRKYVVSQVTFAELLAVVGRSHIALAKIDIEGAEYGVLATVEAGVLRSVRQIIVEFHHDTVRGIKRSDTLDAIRRIESAGMKSVLYNGRDCLFYWPSEAVAFCKLNQLR